MQNRKIRKLAKTLRSTHKKNKSWRKTSEVCKVFTEDGRINPGLCKRIALNGYEPTEIVMERLEQHGAIEPTIRKVKVAHPLSQPIAEMAAATLRALRSFKSSARMQ